MRVFSLLAICFLFGCHPAPAHGSVAQLAQEGFIEVSAWIDEISPGRLGLYYRVENPTDRNLCLLPSRQTIRAEAVPPHKNARYWAQTASGADIFNDGPFNEDYAHSPDAVFDPIAPETNRVFELPFPAEFEGALRANEISWGLSIVIYPCDAFVRRDDGRYRGVLDATSGTDAALFEGVGDGRQGPVALAARRQPGQSTE